MKSRLILGSSSPRRKELLEKVGLEFDIVKPDIDEIILSNEKPSEFVVRIADEKAKKVNSLISGNKTIIAADTVVVINNEILGKPINDKDAADMLNKLSGKVHSVFTGFAILNSNNGVMYTQAVETLVKFKVLNQNEVQGYINSNEYKDKAGGYAIQGIGSFMIESINGSYTNVVGLPLCELVCALNKFKLVKIFN